MSTPTARERAADIFSQRWSSHNLSALVEAAILAAEVAAAEAMREAAAKVADLERREWEKDTPPWSHAPVVGGAREAARKIDRSIRALPLPGGS